MESLARRGARVYGFISVTISLFGASAGFTSIIVVPSDYPTIQQGIDASVDDDTVLVMPGTYVENILIYPDVVVLSAVGPAVTIIDGSQPAHPDSGTVVMFNESSGTIEGFDIRNGSGMPYGGDVMGGGIRVRFAEDPLQGPLIVGNWIHDNVVESEENCVGGGIEIMGAARIFGNRIYHNTVHSTQASYGSAIFARSWWFTPTIIEGNEIFDNHCMAPFAYGAITAVESEVRNNIIACNSGGRASALAASYSATIEANTIAANFSVSEGAAVSLGHGSPTIVCHGVDITFAGNNLTHNVGPGLECIECNGNPHYDLDCNNIAANYPGGQVIGLCADALGQDGNISVDPLYGIFGCPHVSGYWCLSENSPLLIDPPPGCGLIGALGLCPPVGIRDTEPVAPRHLQVSAPRPNPFTSRTTIPFYLAKDGEVEVQIYNVLGRKLRTLHTDWLLVGDHVLEWDGRIEGGDRAASGAYVARIRAGGEELTRTLLLVR